MSAQYSSVLPRFTELMSNHLLCNDLVNSECLPNDDYEDIEESFYDLNELEEVFSDHILIGKRFQKSLYRGHKEDLDEDTNHPPIALTDLALKLFSKAVPNYGLDQLDMDYVSSVSEATSVSPCAMILSLIYLERLRIKNNDYLESVSPSGLFVVTMLVASKFLFENEDDLVTNQIWSEALNIDVKELNELERKFLAAIDWHLYVDSSEYSQYLLSVEKTVALRQFSLRGWLSYSDAYSILQDAVIRKSLTSLIEGVIKVFALSALSYAVSILSVYTVSLAVHCNYNQYNLPSSKEEMKMENDLQKSLPIIANIEYVSNIKFRDSLLENSVTVFSGLPMRNQNTYNYEDNAFNDLYQNTHHEIVLDPEKQSTLSFTSSSLKVESMYDFYIYNNSFFMKLLDFYKLQWLPSGFRNSCISVSVQ